MKINLLGSGYMGKQICSLFVILGYDVIIWQNSLENLDDLLKNEIQKLEKTFNITSSGSYKIEKNLDQLNNHFTIETLTEDLNIKKNIISQLKFKENIFSNTSSISASDLGKNINILHFMNPITTPIVEIYKTEDIYKSLKNISVRKNIIFLLEVKAKRKLLIELINKINKNKFTKEDFNNYAKENSLSPKNIVIGNQNDNSQLGQELLNEVYKFPEKDVFVVNDINFSENYLIYIKKIENVTIKNNSDDYKKYLDLSKLKIATNLYNAYDSYLNKKYEIDINYIALNNIKNNL